MRLQSGMIRFYLCIFLAVSCIAFAATAEKSIDFSGTWIIDPTQTQVDHTTPEIRKFEVHGVGVSENIPKQAIIRGAFPVVWKTGTLQILQTTSEIQIIRRFPIDEQDRTIIQKFKFDESQCLNVSSNGLGEFVSRSHWKNNKLIHSGSHAIFQNEQHVESYVQEEYSLSKNGKKLTIKTTATGLNGVSTIKQVYIRLDK